MDNIFTNSFQDEDPFYQEISDIVDNVLKQKAQEYQKQQLYDYLLSFTTKISNNYLGPNSYYNSYPNYNQIPSINNLNMPSTQYNPYCSSQYNFCQQPMITTNQFSYMIPPNQNPLLYQSQLLQQSLIPYFIQQYLPFVQLESKKNKSKKKLHKKSEKKAKKDQSTKQSKSKKTAVKKKLISSNSFNNSNSKDSGNFEKPLFLKPDEVQLDPELVEIYIRELEAAEAIPLPDDDN